MKLMRYAFYLATCMISVLLGPMLVVGQAKVGVGILDCCNTLISRHPKVRVVEWPTYPLGLISSSTEVTEALEIVDIKVASRSITIGEPFAAAEDWLKTLTFRVRNISGRPIIGVRMGFGLPETNIDNKGLGFSLEYGKGVSNAIPSDDLKVIGPNEEFELRFSDAQYQRHRSFVSERTAVPSFSKVWMGVTSVKFQDGSLWGSGCLRGSNPSNSCIPRAP